MQLIDIRSEVINHGFDLTLFGASRINQYINDAYLEMCARADFYLDEATQTITTVSGTATSAFPTDFGRIRSLYDSDRNLELTAVGIRDIDRTAQSSGWPRYYAVDGANIHLAPTPDAVYNLKLRYWKIPAVLVNDTDVPIIPARWHKALWEYATMECYAAEDDYQTASQWEARYDKTVAKFQADVKFPSSDYPSVVSSMWDHNVRAPGWTYGG